MEAGLNEESVLASRQKKMMGRQWLKRAWKRRFYIIQKQCRIGNCFAGVLKRTFMVFTGPA
jgi:hypothetical protein